MAGAGEESTLETIRRTELVASLGAHFASILTKPLPIVKTETGFF